MAISIKFDTANNPLPPNFILANRNGDKIGLIDNITNINVRDCMNDVPEVSFNVNRYNNGVECAYWDDIRDFKLAYCMEWDMWFEITIDINISTETVKNVSLIKLANAELSQILIHTTQINTEEDIARDDYKEPTILYNPVNHDASLLHRILEKAPHYEVVHIDSTIADIQRTFEFDGISIDDALKEIATEIDALVVYDSSMDRTVVGGISRKISMYDLEENCLDCGHRESFVGACPKCGSENIKRGYGVDTMIFIDDERTLGDDITLDIDTDSVKNCFKLKTGDDLLTATVKNCSPNGTDYLWYFSDDIKNDMSDELRDKIEAYDDLYNYYKNDYEININNDKLSAYNELVNKYKDFNSELENIQNPIVGYPNLMQAYYNTIDFELYLTSGLLPSLDTDDITAQNQANLLTSVALSPVAMQSLNSANLNTSNNAILGLAKLLVHPQYRVKVNTSSYSNYVWTGNFILTNPDDEEDVATSEMISVTINADYETFVRQKLEKALYEYQKEFNTSISGLFEKDLDDFKVALKKYGMNPLTSLYDACQACLDIMIEQGISSNPNEEVYSVMYTPYYTKLSAIQDEINIRESEIKVITNGEDALQELLVEERNEIQNRLNFERYIGEELWIEFCSFRREDIYENENYISDGLDNAELFKKALEFLDVAEKEIYKSGTLQHKLTATLRNLLVIEQFRPLTQYFSCGNWIRIKIDDIIYKLRLLEYSLDYNDLSTASVVFSDVISISNGISDTKSILDQANSIATSYDTVKRQAQQGSNSNNRLDDWVKKGLDATTINIVNKSENQTQTWDNHGIWCRQYDDITESYLKEQVKIINSGLYVTNDNWETTKAGIGRFEFYNPKTKVTEQRYGVIAETLVSNLVLSEEVGIYTPDGNVIIDNKGISVAKPDNDNYGTLGSGYVYLGKDGFSVGGDKLVYKSSTDTLTLGSSVSISWNNISNGTGIVTSITNNAISTMYITAKQIDVDSVFAEDITATGTITGATLVGAYIEADEGMIGGWTINEVKMFGGDGNPNTPTAVVQRPIAGENTYVFACGGASHKNYSDCPFRVSGYGNVWTNNLNVGGTLKINGTNITSLFATTSDLSNCVKTNASTTLTSQLNMGTGTDPVDKMRYYINGNGVGRFSNINIEGKTIHEIIDARISKAISS